MSAAARSRKRTMCRALSAATRATSGAGCRQRRSALSRASPSGSFSIRQRLSNTMVWPTAGSQVWQQARNQLSGPTQQQQLTRNRVLSKQQGVRDNLVRRDKRSER